MADINRLALVRLRNPHMQPVAPSGNSIAPRIDNTASRQRALGLDADGDGQAIPRPEYGPQPTSRSSGVERTDVGANPTYQVQ